MSNMSFIPQRVFINNVDKYNGKHFSNIIADQLFKEYPQDVEEQSVEDDFTLSLLKPDKPQPIKYEVVGTANDPDYKNTEDVSRVLDKNSPEFIEEILKCGVVVFDITDDPGEIELAHAILKAVVKVLGDEKDRAPKKFEQMSETRTFVLVSSIMTWAKTKPIDPDEPDLPFVETDYRKRKCHPNYKKHLELEKETLSKGKQFETKFRTYVIASGVLYGFEENDLHVLFQMAWNNASELPIVESGKNIVPMIHITDLCTIICAVFKSVPGTKYIFAVEQCTISQEKIVKSISRSLGSARTKIVTKTDAFLIPELTQTYYDRLTVDLKTEPGCIVNDLSIHWTTDLNLSDNTAAIVQEYKNARKLEPIKIMLHGPIAVGKSRIAHQLCEHYNLHYVTVPEVMSDGIERMYKDLAYYKEQIKGTSDDETDDEEDYGEKAKKLSSKLNEIERVMEINTPDMYIVEFLRDKLASNECQNQGYVLDGYPETTEQANELFKFAPDEIEDEELDSQSDPILPEFIISLEAPDKFLTERVIQFSELKLQELGYNEEKFVQKLEEFRTNNTDENTLLNLFDELDVHPIVIDATKSNIFSSLKDKIGVARGYPPTQQELEEIENVRGIIEDQVKEVETQKRLQAEQRATEDRERLQEQWMDALQVLQEEEQRKLAAQGEPLREYLTKFVLPVLTDGLLQVAALKPSDPLDFLAEFLFKQNPEGRALDPSYATGHERIRKIAEDFRDNLGEAQ